MAVGCYGGGGGGGGAGCSHTVHTVKVLRISSFTLNYIYFRFELFLVMTHFVGDSWRSR